MPDSRPSAFSLISLGQFGERARPVRGDLHEAALVIGLGQVGLQAVARVHDMLNVMFTRRDLQANIRLLAIARRRTIREETALPREERLMLTLDPLPWGDVPGRYAQLGVAQWWPHSPRAREVHDDPTQVRAYSRLLLYDNAALVSEALYKLAQWLNEAGTGRDLNLKRRIYVLASIAEAEGGGMLFDIVSRLRALARQKPTEIIGIFSLRAPADPNDPEKTLAMANVYATLREIDSYTPHPDQFTSSLPVIGHSLDRRDPKRALDMILLNDDANSSCNEPSENALAECAVTWIAASLLPPGQVPPLPGPIAEDTSTDRFSGYSTFGISKLALPTRAAMDFAAVGMAQVALTAIKSTHASTPTSGWWSQIVSKARQTLLAADLRRETAIAERLREWDYDLSLAGLIRRLETRTARGESVRMLDLVQAEWRRLERESVKETIVEQVVTSPDTLRVRVDTVFAAPLEELYAMLAACPIDLAYAKGYGLIWTVSALDELERQLREDLPAIQQLLSETQAAFQIARQTLFDVAQQFDLRGSGRGRKTISANLDADAHAGIEAVAGWIIAQARHDAWQALRTLVDNLREQVREVIPLIEPTSQSLREFETTCRLAMEQAAAQPPTFPAGVALTQPWYRAGIQELGSMGQLPPRDVLCQLFKAWVPPADLPPERQLSRFVSEIRDAARRALSGSFRFADLYEFLNQNQAAYRPVVMALPGSASPAMIPTTDDKHPTPAPYEIIREAPRAASLYAAAQKGLTRCFIPSPDPDEITVMRLLNGTMAEALPALREVYRRAYDRAGAEGMPLHIDRRWDATMADLVHTTARREVSMQWENIVTALKQNPKAMNQPVESLIRSLGLALDVAETVVTPGLPADLRIVVYKLRPFRLKLPPPSCAVVFVLSNRAAEAVGEAIYRGIASLPLEEQFVFVVNVSGRHDMDLVIEPLRRVDFTALVLEEADIKHLISARMPTRALGDLVLNQVSLNTVSPFYTRGPVPEHMFFGREREISEVRSKLRTHSVALIGGRRIGKTSTLQRIQRLLKLPESDYVPYYLDCHGATNYRSFFWLVNRRWEVDIPENANPVQFEDVVTILQRRHPRKNIVILFDEVDPLLRFDREKGNQETLFRTFRSLSNEKRCQYILSGEKWLMRAVSDSYSALFNFAQSVRLEPLPPKVVHSLVADPFEMLNIWMEQSEQIIERIYEISAGHPNIVQMICQAMIEELDRNPQNANLLTFEHLDKTTRRRTLQEEIVQTIWGQMDPLARLITLIWPEGERFLTLAEIEKQLAEIGMRNIPPEQLERTAKDLELYCFVRPGGNDRLELIPMAFPAILDFMTDKRRQIEIVRRKYDQNPEGGVAS